MSIPPLKTLTLSSAPLTTHAIAWSPDAELAIACDDAISIFFPAFPNPSSQHGKVDGVATATGGSGSLVTSLSTMLPASITQPGQFFSLRTRWPCTRPPEPRINAALLAAAGVELRISRGGEDDVEEEDDEWQDEEGKSSIAEQQHPTSRDPNRWWDSGSGPVTRFGAAVSQVVSLAWSPSGLGHNLRPVLAVLLTSGAVLVYGEQATREDVERELGSRVRSFRGWATLWGVGARMPLVDKSANEGWRPCDDRITAFAWAKAVRRGEGILSYLTARGEVVLMRVRYKHGDGCEWAVDEVGRFAATGPHSEIGVWDPDHVPSASVFSLAWSPWLHTGHGLRSAVIAYTARHYIGFRRVTIDPALQVTVEETDLLGVCCHLGTDAFVVWEEAITTTARGGGGNAEAEGAMPVCRALIATPFTVREIQIPLSEPAAAPMAEHHVGACGTQYPPPDVSPEDLTNPITGLLVQPSHPDDPNHARSFYSLTRLSATNGNENWYQESDPHANAVPDTADPSNSANRDATPPRAFVPQWADYIRRTIQIQVPVSVGLAGAVQDEFDATSESGDREDEDEESDAEGEPDDDLEEEEMAGVGGEDDALEVDGAEAQVFPFRIRIWGLAASPGGRGSVVLASQHSTQRPERVCRMLVMFAWQEQASDGAVTVGPPRRRGADDMDEGMSTEGKVWEWMYANGPPVQGFRLGDGAAGEKEDGDGDGTAGAEAVMPSVLAARLIGLKSTQRCAYCTTELRDRGQYVRCQHNHMFDTCAASGLAILAPGISRVCSVCGRRTLVLDALQRLASEGGAGDVVEDVAEVVACGGCGGKFIV